MPTTLWSSPPLSKTLLCRSMLADCCLKLKSNSSMKIESPKTRATARSFLGVCKKRDQISLGGIIHNPLLRLLSSSSLYSSSKNANTTSYGGRGLSEKKQRLQRCGTPALWKLDDGAFMTEKSQVDCDVALFGGLAKHSVPESHGHRVV
jgi:hypothetical protein